MKANLLVATMKSAAESMIAKAILNLSLKQHNMQLKINKSKAKIPAVT